MYKYTVEIYKDFEPSNQEQRSELVTYLASFDTREDVGVSFVAKDNSDLILKWKEKYPRIDFYNVKILEVLEESTGKIIFIDLLQ